MLFRSGTLFTTQVGEKTILVKNFVLLSKVLRPLPMPKVDADGNVYDAFTDPEMRYRMRYVDMVVNPHVKEVFLKRTKLFNAMRQFFNDAGYLEVETPVLQSIPGGVSPRAESLITAMFGLKFLLIYRFYKDF